MNVGTLIIVKMEMPVAHRELHAQGDSVMDSE
jgi:hypothetical protein